ncbi:hypothetical protein [Ruminococcus sp. AM42-11]|nr:hypothetical protein [Ruminococcus sp. AM42-11]
MEFTNTYTTSGQIALGATKTLEGQTLEQSSSASRQQKWMQMERQ